MSPYLYSNRMPVDVQTWRDFDGRTIESGPDVEFEFLDPKDHRSIYALYTFEHETCTDNVIDFKNRRGSRFDVRWTGRMKDSGTWMNDDIFELQAVAEFVHVDFGGDVESEDQIDEDEIGRIFAEVLPLSDFVQHPVEVRRIAPDSAGRGGSGWRSGRARPSRFQRAIYAE